MNVLLLKSLNEDDEQCLYQKELLKHGFTSKVIKSLEFDLNPSALLEYQNVGLDGFLFTSKVAVRVLNCTEMRERMMCKPCFAVGKSTGALLKSIGCTDVRGEDSGSMKELLKFISETFLRNSVILWPCGNLSQNNFSVTEEVNIKIEPVVCYKTKKINNFGDELDRAFSQSAFDIIVPFSPSIASAFHDWAKESKCITEKIAVVALGPSTEARVNELDHMVLRGVCRKPTPEDMTECIRELLR